jgi:pimeloyl-ACP methyl ester carboxylesterase
MKLMSVLALAIACLALAGPARAFEPQSTGVVVMHGKWGSAGDKTTVPVVRALQGAGFLVDQPEMPWSGARLYDRDYDAAMVEIDAAAARLKARGATKIVIAGQSLGGNAALRYATLGRPVDAFVLMAPAHFPDNPVLREKLAGATAQAQNLVAAGKGDTQISIVDFNSGDRTKSIHLTAASYLSYFLPDGPAAMSAFASKVGPVQILLVEGTLDSSSKGFVRAVLPRIPPQASITRIDVVADHLDVPQAGQTAIVKWLRER